MGYALSGKTALVTGANRGIGEAIVDALVAAGVKKVYAAARNISTLDPLVDRHGSRVVPLQLDVTNAAQIANAAATATDVDLLVNNAGIVGFFGGEFTDPKWIAGGRQEMAPSPTSTRWPRSSASRFSRRTAPRRPRRIRSLR
jgi:NAD(P)-dependent dehydrogenase (short-subunit alcohol dehydrogenase family)